MSRHPYHKRYHGDAIAGYMGLSLEERGAYATLKDYIYDREGPLPSNMRMLAGYLDCSVRKAAAVIESLIQKGKLYRLEDGRISNRRCDQELGKLISQADHMAEIGSSGGKKSAEARKKPNEIKESVERPLDPRSSHTRDQSLYTRVQKEEKKVAANAATEPDGSGVTDAPAVPSKALSAVVITDLDLAVKFYNDAAATCPGGAGAGWAASKRLTGAREKALRARLKEVGLEGWKAALVRAANSDFLSGRAARGRGHESWGVDIGWLAKAENFTKLMEGNYDNGRGKTKLVGVESSRAGLLSFLEKAEGRA